MPLPQRVALFALPVVLFAHLGAGQAPAFIVIGDEDLELPEHAVKMSRLMPHGRLAILPGIHGGYMGEAMTPDTGSKEPRVFVTLVDEFLAAPMPAC